MEHKYKIVILVTLQISLIVASTLIIVYSESEINLTGNTVNVAGKNRVLTSQVQIELNHLLLYDSMHNTQVLEALENLENNVLFLKHGGQLSEIKISPLASRFDSDWNEIWNTFEGYKVEVSDLVSQENTSLEGIVDAEQTGNVLVHLSDVLTDKLGKDIEQLSSRLIFLQIMLGLINVAAHISMISLIWRIFNRHAEQKIKTEKFVALGEFAAMVAHDMKNPLGTIRNSMTLIQSKGGGRTIPEETQRINRAIKRMSHQVEGVLNYVRTIPLVLETASIREIIKQSLDNVQMPDTISLSIPDEDAVVQCDTEKLEFVFTNILLNAVQALGNDHGYITVKLDDKQNAVVLSFENSGSSISKDDAFRIFEPLFTTKLQGTGLGLTSCKNIIERHHGTITASNNPVTFTISLPKQV